VFKKIPRERKKKKRASQNSKSLSSSYTKLKIFQLQCSTAGMRIPQLQFYKRGSPSLPPLIL